MHNIKLSDRIFYALSSLLKCVFCLLQNRARHTSNVVGHCIVWFFFFWYANFIDIENPIVDFIMIVVWKNSRCLVNDSISLQSLSLGNLSSLYNFFLHNWVFLKPYKNPFTLVEKASWCPLKKIIMQFEKRTNAFSLYDAVWKGNAFSFSFLF